MKAKLLSQGASKTHLQVTSLKSGGSSLIENDTWSQTNWMQVGIQS